MALRRAGVSESIVTFPGSGPYYGLIVANPPSLGKIHDQILAVMKDHPEGLSEAGMRIAIGLASGEQGQFRRRRQLYRFHDITLKRIGKKVVYVYSGPNEQPFDAGTTQKLRA